MRLWKNVTEIREGKYLVLRRDGTIPDWPRFVMGACDPAVPAALEEYAEAAERLGGYDPEYVADVRRLAEEFRQYRAEHGDGDPSAPRHRKDDPETIAKMTAARGS